MKFLLTLTILLSSQSLLAQEAAQYKGHLQVERQVFTRIFNKTTRHPDLGSFINSSGFFFSNPLLDLIGFYPGGVNNGEMTNGNPNAISFLIHYLIFSEIAERISEDCLVSEDPLLVQEYKVKFLKNLQSICAVDPMHSLSDGHYFDFWTTLVGFEAPFVEYDSWKNFLSQHTFNDKKARMREMTLLAMMNPFFFIQN